MSNGTEVTYYANGTSQRDDQYLLELILDAWIDGDCNYTKYASGTWADCQNMSTFYFIPPEKYNTSTSEIVIGYEYFDTGFYYLMAGGYQYAYSIYSGLYPLTHSSEIATFMRGRGMETIPMSPLRTLILPTTTRLNTMIRLE